MFPTIDKTDSEDVVQDRLPIRRSEESLLRHFYMEGALPTVVTPLEEKDSPIIFPRQRRHSVPTIPTEPKREVRQRRHSVVSLQPLDTLDSNKSVTPKPPKKKRDRLKAPKRRVKKRDSELNDWFSVCNKGIDTVREGLKIYEYPKERRKVHYLNKIKK